MPADETMSAGIPCQSVGLLPPRKVGTPDSADTPAPVRTRTRVESAKRRRSSAEIVGAEMLCIVKSDGSTQPLPCEGFLTKPLSRSPSARRTSSSYGILCLFSSLLIIDLTHNDAH